MDKSTVVGIVGAFGIVTFAIVLVTKGSLDLAYTLFWDTPSLILVVIGSIFCTLMSVKWKTFADTLRIVRKCLVHSEERLDVLIPRLVEYAAIARREGKMALESRMAAGNEDPFLVKGMQMAIDGQDAEEIEGILRVDLIGLRSRHRAGKQLFVITGKYAPAFGLLTTIVGEITMLSSIGTGTVNVAEIGKGMSFALLGTLYGIIMANLVFLPLADKLEGRSQEELLVKELYIQLVVGIAEETAPAVVRQNLIAFLDHRTAGRVAAAEQVA